MLSKSTLKYIRSLRQVKYRQKYHKIVVEGTKSVLEVLNGQLLQVDAIYALEDWILANEVSLKKSHAEVQAVAEHELKGLSSFSTPQSVLAICEMPHSKVDPEGLSQSLCLYLDGIRDPGNVGTIFRIADWFGIGQVFLSPDTVDPFNPKVIQASMGSLFRIAWAEGELNQILASTGLTAFVTTLQGENIFTADLPDNGMIVLGNESVGVRDNLISGPLRQIMIPGSLSRGAESLNVAVAAGIICSEFRRPRGPRV